VKASYGRQYQANESNEDVSSASHVSTSIVESRSGGYRKECTARTVTPKEFSKDEADNF
jgi:hypothetical protein